MDLANRLACVLVLVQATEEKVDMAAVRATIQMKKQFVRLPSLSHTSSVKKQGMKDQVEQMECLMVLEILEDQAVA